MSKRAAALLAAAGWLSVCGLSFYSFLVGSLDPDGCKKTFMDPNYLPTSDFRPNVSFFPDAARYALALYREGGLDPSTPSGVPVLFIPGNAGSSHQARSLGRILATLRGSDGLSFDLFTVDTREELTAFDVDLIVDQSAYVNEAIKYILTLYAGGHRRPDSVIIVGHSMGGIVARSLLRMPNYTPGSVATIFTKATPHKAPPVAASRRMHDYYRSLNEFWAARLRDDGTSAESRSLMLVSLAGGTRDTMIDSRLTDVSEIVGGANGFSAFATGVPRVWGSADHRCVLWCKQLVTAVGRAVFAATDPASGRPIALGPRIEAVEPFFRNRFDAMAGRPRRPPLVPTRWRRPAQTSRIASSRAAIEGQADGTWFERRLLDQPSAARVQILSQQPVKVYVCANAGSEESCFDHSFTGDALPTALPSNKIKGGDELKVDVNAEDSFVHYVELDVASTVRNGTAFFQVAPSSFAAIDFEPSTDDVVELPLDSLTSLIPQTIDIPTPSLQTTVRLPRLTYSFFDLRVRVSGRCGTRFQPVIQFASTCGAESRFLLPPGDGRLRFAADGECGQTWRIWTDHGCGSVAVHVSVDWFATLGNLARRYGVNLISMGTGVVLLAVSRGYARGQSSNFENFHTGLVRVLLLHISILFLERVGLLNIPLLLESSDARLLVASCTLYSIAHSIMRVAIIAFDAVVGVARFVSKRIPAVISAHAPPAVLLAATSIAFGTALTPALLSPLTFLVLVYRAAGSRRAPGGGGSSSGDPQLLLRGLGVLALVVVAFDAGPLAAWATRGRGSDSGLQLLHGVAAARWELWLGAPLLALGVAADRPIRGRGRSMRLVTMVAAVLATVVPASHLYLVKWIIAAWAASHFCATVI